MQMRHMQNAASCLASTEQVSAIRKTAKSNGFHITGSAKDGTLVVATVDEDGEHGQEIYRALRTGSRGNSWLVRFDTTCFE